MHPGPSCRRPDFSAGWHIGDRDLEVRAKAVKFSGAPGPENLTPVTPLAKETAFSARLCALLAGAGGVGLERADALGKRSTALGESGCRRAIRRRVIGRARRRPWGLAGLRSEEHTSELQSL